MKIHLVPRLLLAVASIQGLCACGNGLKNLLGKDYPDKVIKRKDIVEACGRLKSLIDGGRDLVVSYVVWEPDGNLGFGEHAAIEIDTGPGPDRESYYVDIGRRPEDAASPAVSVLRVFDYPSFLRYSKGARRSRENISRLCRTAEARELARATLQDLRPFLDAPDADPVEWKFHILFNNCARYAQKRVGESLSDPELRTMVLKFRESVFISPSDLRIHMEICNSYAEQKKGDIVAALNFPVDLQNYFDLLPVAELRVWVARLERDKAPGAWKKIVETSLRKKLDEAETAFPPRD